MTTAPPPPRRRPSSLRHLSESTRGFVADCAAALRACPPGKACLYLGGRALLSAGGGAGADDDGVSSDATSALPGALFAAGRVAAAAQAALLCQNGFARADRGAGRPPLVRVPYFPKARRDGPSLEAPQSSNPRIHWANCCLKQPADKRRVIAETRLIDCVTDHQKHVTQRVSALCVAGCLARPPDTEDPSRRALIHP